MAHLKFLLINSISSSHYINIIIHTNSPRGISTSMNIHHKNATLEVIRWHSQSKQIRTPLPSLKCISLQLSFTRLKHPAILMPLFTTSYSTTSSKRDAEPHIVGTKNTLRPTSPSPSGDSSKKFGHKCFKFPPWFFDHTEESFRSQFSPQCQTVVFCLTVFGLVVEVIVGVAEVGSQSLILSLSWSRWRSSWTTSTLLWRWWGRYSHQSLLWQTLSHKPSNTTNGILKTKTYHNILNPKAQSTTIGVFSLFYKKVLLLGRKRVLEHLDLQ